MKIFGIGTDIVNIRRIDKALKKNGKKFKNRIFSKNEIKYCEDKKYPSSYFAKRFAAKEAFSKALGIGIRKGVNLKDIEILNDNFGKPNVLLKGYVSKYLMKKIKNKKYFVYLSLSDDKPWAQATVIISYN
tara:strand:- start:548 stop:940 length:393 start_codon:yes stop_codon:yes gene_type:complete